MSVAVQTRSLPQYMAVVGFPSPLVLTTHELLQEAEAVAMRIAHSSLPARDAMVVLQLAERLRRLA